MDSKIDRRTALIGLSGAFLAACGGGSLYGPAAGFLGSPVSNALPLPIRPPGQAAVPLYWSDIATNALLDEYAIAYEFVGPVWGPADDTRTLAMMFIAGHDALNATRRLYAPYLFSPVPDPSADPDLAYATAACRVLQSRMPWRSEFGVAYRAMLDGVSDGLAKTRAVEIGEASAQAILDDRANDGADQAWGDTYVAGPAPGDYRPTPPYYKAWFVNWGQVRPFALTAGSQFRAPSPYAVTDPAYATDFAEVKLKGDADGSARSMNERETADIFWSQTVPLGWQQIARELVRYSYTDSGPDGRWAGARIFALLQIALADAYITALDSKYHHRFWRPITAIGLADSDGNPDTIADVAWQPFHPETPPVPEYPSASALAATAAATALAAVVPPYFDTVVYANPWFPARRREYPETGDGLRGFGAIADDTGLSQILFGHNFRRSVEVGWELGASVGRWAVDHRLSALPV